MKHLVLMCLVIFRNTHPTQSEIHHRGITEGAVVSIYCKHEGKVTWRKDRDGNRLTILTAESKDEIQKYIADPHNRYSVTDDLSLHIKNVSVSDSGIYYCNGNPAVNLTVTASDENRATISLRHPDTTTTPDSNPQKTDDEIETTMGPIYSPPEHTTTNTDSSTRTAYKFDYDEIETTMGPVYSPPEHTTSTTTTDSSTRTAFTSYCIKENK